MKQNVSFVKLVKLIIIALCCVFISALVGLLLEVLVYLIPTDRIRENIARGVDVYNNETNFYAFSEDYLSTMNDNDSDSVILGMTAYSTGNPLKDALESRYPSIAGNEWLPRVLNIVSYAHFHDDEYDYVSYARYWHGYVVILKPFFYFFDFADARVFNYIILLGLYMYVGYLLIREGLAKYLIAYFALLALFNPVIIPLTFQYLPCTYIMLITMAVVLKYGKVLKRRDLISWVFLVTGILTAFFDFLTFPFVTLGVPSVLLLLYDDSNINKLKECIKSGFLWCIGYVGMWSGKWLLSSIILKRNLFEEAGRFIAHRTGNVNPETDRIDAFISVVMVIAKWPYILLILGMIVFVVFKYIIPSIRNHTLKKYCFHLLPFILVGLYGVIWILFTYEHCYENLKFTYRELGITVFAFVSGAIYSERNKTI